MINDFGMFTDQGDLAVGKAVGEFEHLVMTGNHLTPEEFSHWWNKKISEITRSGHGEVGDTVVREAILNTTDEILKPLGYDIRQYCYI